MIDKVDIIITTRNRIEELLFTLRYCRNIGFKEEQFFIIDDASTDGTSTAVQDEFTGVRLIKNKVAMGYIYNRNIMMHESGRPYVLSLDDDSHIRTAKDIQEAIELLNSKPEYGIFTFNAFEQLLEPPAKQELPDVVREVRTYIGCGHILKREVIQRLGKYREAFEFYCEELDYSIRAYQHGYKVITKDNLVVHHRVNWELRSKQLKDDLSKGVYGAIWRSKLGFSNNLLVVALHYSYGLDIVFGFYYLLLRIKNFLIAKRDVKGFIGGISRFLKLLPRFWKEREKMSFSTFKYWIRLEAR